MPVLMSADNPVGRIVKAVVLGAKKSLVKGTTGADLFPKRNVWFGLGEGGIAAVVVVDIL